ncbi:GNAT family N-acetyltransferase [Brevundimonas sp. A19_0]|uniref:GNAT family N-acetyltransferase n=1 Tax=Brevundimonas sp. A19_0 TaxID=2821087 RepID=UPI001ADB924F|nr:GNAT family N-acetyltransferase [Brevundimonas sp. A19_0]MBO9500720.1 GNAT family N-acetyltransferase [Brevundimonas sp. A19_0]
MAQITATRCPAAALPEAEADAWRAFQRQQPAFANPLMGPDFARAVGRVREDAEVVTYRRSDEIVGFLGLHRRPGGFARPLGVPFADYHALVTGPAPGFKGREALTLAGVRAFRHIGLIDPFGLFDSIAVGPTAFAIALPEGPDAHLEAIRAANPKRAKNYRRLLNRLSDVGPLRLQASRDRADFDQLLAWKSEQFRRTGLQDVLRPAWVRGLMSSLFETYTPRFGGLMLTLHAGDTLAGGHFGVIANGIYHPWIASTNPALVAASPGNAFLDQVIRAMPDLGIRVYDLGPGHDHYKQPFSSTLKSVGVGLTLTDTRAGGLMTIGSTDWASGVDAPLAKVRRRLDHIAAVDPTAAGRAMALVDAMRAIPRRLGGAD